MGDIKGDEDLIEKIKHSPSEGLEEAIELYGGAVKTICTSILRGYAKEDIEETVSDVFAALWRGIANYRPEQVGLKSYIYGIARNCANQKKKALSIRLAYCEENLVTLQSSYDLEEGAIHHLNTEIMLELIERLKPPADLVFMYRYFYDCKVEEIAKKLDISVKKVENILFRYKEKLRKQFEERGIGL